MAWRHEKELRISLCSAARTLAEEKLIRGGEGNISARIPGSNLVLIKPSGIELKNMKKDDLIVIDLYGKIIKGNREPSKETPMHLAIYRSRSDVNAIVHTHPLFATCIGITEMKLLPLSIYALREIVRGIPIVPFHPPGSIELAEAVVKALEGDKHVAILRGHGLVVASGDIETATKLSIYLERAAKIQIICSLIGKFRLVETEIIEKLFKKFENT